MSVIFDSKKKTFYLNTNDTTYAFLITPTGFLKHLYYGDKLNDFDIDLESLSPKFKWNLSPEYNSKKEDSFSLNQMLNEYSAFGLGDYREVSFKVTYNDGSRNNDLKYVSHEIHQYKSPIKNMPSLRGDNELVIVLKDEYIELTLFYSVYEKENAITRRAIIKNINNNIVTINSIMSGQLDLFGNDYTIVSLSGEWGKERQIIKHPLNNCIIKIDSKRGASGHSQNPFVLLSKSDTNEYSGLAIGLNLVYSGSFVFKCEHTFDNLVRIVSGINDFDFAWELKREEQFETPELVITYSNCGVNKMSQQFHDLYRNYLINPKYAFKERPILLNNWEATSINFTKENLIKLINEASKYDIDTFVLDDGWFGKREEGFDKGLGDWFVNENKLEGGLKPIIDECKKHNIKFGLWFEPEMINEDSDIYRLHPEYAMKSPKGIINRNRYQLVMDLVNEDAFNYVKESISKILDNNDISYVKWDFNRNLTEYYSQALLPQEQASFAHRYMLQTYRLMDYFVNRYPNIFFEGCASGGGRFDPAMLYYFPQIWCSDNSDAYSREFIQYGTSIVYPLSSFTGHVSVCPSHVDKRITPFKTRCDIASLCSTGFELDITNLSSEEKEEMRNNIKRYKEISSLIRNGDLYRLNNPFEEDLFSMMIVSKDKSNAFVVIGVGKLQKSTSKYLKFKGLGDYNYLIKELGVIKTKSQLEEGILLEFTQDYQTYSFILNKQ